MLELRPALPVPVDEMWCWSAGHQAAEREAEEDLGHGRHRDHDAAASLLADLQDVIDGGSGGR